MHFNQQVNLKKKKLNGIYYCCYYYFWKFLSNNISLMNLKKIGFDSTKLFTGQQIKFQLVLILY
jgi:hypothetical protein